MDLFEFLEDEDSELQIQDIVKLLNAVYTDSFDLSFVLTDRNGRVIFPVEADSIQSADNGAEARDRILSGAPYVLDSIDASRYRLTAGIPLSGSVKGFASCEVDTACPRLSAAGMRTAEDIRRILASPVTACIDVYIRYLEARQASTRHATKEKHDSNALEDLRYQYHEILSENIRQREELEEKNEQLAVKQEQLEDYNRNLEQKIEERTRELRQAKEKAEGADRLKSQFLANMSHEMRTPLNAIIGFADMLLEEQLQDGHRDFLQKVAANSRLLLHLVNDILDLSKIEAGYMQVARLPTSLERILYDTDSNAQTLVARTGKPLAIRNNCGSDFHHTILTDPERLQQVMNNLISNAVKFTKEGFIEYGVSLKDRHTLLFYVQDTGIGIPLDKQDVVFELFQQADMSTTRTYGGTGLGLTITKKLIELMGGCIWIASEAGQGTTVFFTLPYFPVEERQPESPDRRDNPAAPAAQSRIMLVEDSPDNQMLIESILKKNGYCVRTAVNGRESLDLYEALHDEIDLILMDMQMPVMGGLEATQAIREFEQAQHVKKIPIVALTAGAMKGDREQCLEAGCNAYLKKPINKTELLSTIRRYTIESDGADNQKDLIPGDITILKNNEE